MTKTTQPADAAAWADAQVRRHTHWPLDILGAGPHCAGNCKQGRALCVSPEQCGVQKPVAQPAPAEASTDIGAEQAPRMPRLRKPLMTPAGWFWLVYGASLAAALVLPHLVRKG